MYKILRDFEKQMDLLDPNPTTRPRDNKKENLPYSGLHCPNVSQWKLTKAKKTKQKKK